MVLRYRWGHRYLQGQELLGQAQEQLLDQAQALLLELGQALLSELLLDQEQGLVLLH